MGHIREPLDVNFVVEPRPLTKEERKAISNYIREYKIKHLVKKNAVMQTKKKIKTREKVSA